MSSSLHPLSPEPSPVTQPSMPLLYRFFRETRTRILLLYALLMLPLTGLTVPIFRTLLFQQVNSRVSEDLAEERLEFLEAYRIWELPPNQTVDDLKSFLDDYLQENLPEDDNFHIALINGELHRSNPTYLLEPLRPGSKLFRRWQNVKAFNRGDESISDPSIGTILYKAEPLMLEGEQQGVFVVAHSAAGERQEALVGMYLFAWMVFVVVILSLFLAWLGAGRLMAPIHELSKTARSISDSDLTGRIPPVEGHGELADLADTFNAMMNRIQQAFESQRAFINDAGHELRTPITIVRGHLELLEDDPQERQETVELVIDELDRMGRLVNDMILLAKSEQADFLQLETIEAGSLTEALFAKAKTLAQRDWVLKIEGRGEIVGDRQRLTGAILNLLRNATQHTEVSDTIELGCCVRKYSPPKEELNSGKQVEIWVRDTGEGIAPADQQRIFDRFFRVLDNKRHLEGSGLGLSIVSAIVEAHGGQVSLVSELDKGSTFRISLPMDFR